MINNIFRFDENVPTNYVRESRDMQMMLRLWTYGINCSKYESEQIEYINNAELCNDRILSLLSEKAQFMDSENIKSDILRYIVQNFSGLLRGKGTEEKIAAATHLYLMAYKMIAPTTIYVDNDTYEVNIGIGSSIRDVSVLETMLKYLIPVGYVPIIFFYEDIEARMVFKFKQNTCIINIPENETNYMYILSMSQPNSRKRKAVAANTEIKAIKYPTMETVLLQPMDGLLTHPAPSTNSIIYNEIPIVDTVDK